MLIVISAKWKTSPERSERSSRKSCVLLNLPPISTYRITSTTFLLPFLESNKKNELIDMEHIEYYHLHKYEFGFFSESSVRNLNFLYVYLYIYPFCNKHSYVTKVRRVSRCCCQCQCLKPKKRWWGCPAEFQNLYSAYLSLPQPTSAYLSLPKPIWVYLSLPQPTSA